MATQIWTGQLADGMFRVVDNGSGNDPRLVVEIRGQPDALGGFGWSRFDPIPTAVFTQILISAGVLT